MDIAFDAKAIVAKIEEQNIRAKANSRVKMTVCEVCEAKQCSKITSKIDTKLLPNDCPLSPGFNKLLSSNIDNINRQLFELRLELDNLKAQELKTQKRILELEIRRKSLIAKYLKRNKKVIRILS